MITSISSNKLIDAVRLMDRRRTDATKINDVPALTKIIDDDLVYIGRAGAIYDKTNYLEAVASEKLVYERDFRYCRMPSQNLSRHGYIDRDDVRPFPARRPQQVYHRRCMSVWRQRGDLWGMIGWQSSELSPRTS